MMIPPSNTHLDGAKVDWIDPRGYIRLRLPNHPLACSNGVVPRHRAVLWEALGCPLTSRCYWCGYELLWKSMVQPSMTFVVHVDHLNETPGDDRAGNLVPSCFWCNAHRGYMVQCAPGIWQILLDNLCEVPPRDRVAPLKMLAFAGGADGVTRWSETDLEHPSEHPSLRAKPQVRATAVLLRQFYTDEDIRHTRQHRQKA